MKPLTRRGQEVGCQHTATCTGHAGTVQNINIDLHVKIALMHHDNVSQIKRFQAILLI